MTYAPYLLYSLLSLDLPIDIMKRGHVKCIPLLSKGKRSICFTNIHGTCTVRCG